MISPSITLVRTTPNSNQTYDNLQCNTRLQKQQLCTLANALNSRAQPYTYYHSEGKLVLCGYFTQPYREYKSVFVKRVFNEIFTWDEVEWFEDGLARVYDAEHQEYTINRDGNII